MTKFKDKMYNKNDIIVALTILLVAATVIAVRVHVIMDYPNTIAEASGTKTETISEQKSDDKNVNASKSEKSINAKNDSKTANSSKAEDTSKTAGTLKAGDASKTDKTDNKNKSGTVKVKIRSNYASYDVAKLLRSKGLVNSAYKFDKLMQKKKVESYIQNGTFKIPKNSTDKEIIKIITGRDI